MHFGCKRELHKSSCVILVATILALALIAPKPLHAAPKKSTHSYRLGFAVDCLAPDLHILGALRMAKSNGKDLQFVRSIGSFLNYEGRPARSKRFVGTLRMYRGDYGASAFKVIHATARSVRGAKKSLMVLGTPGTLNLKMESSFKNGTISILESGSRKHGSAPRELQCKIEKFSECTVLDRNGRSVNGCGARSIETTPRSDS